MAGDGDSPILLSEHVRRYNGVSVEALEKMVETISAFLSAQNVDERGGVFVVDFVTQLVTLYKSVKNDNIKLKAQIGTLSRAQERQGASGSTTQATAGPSSEADVLDDSATTEVWGLVNVEKINLNRLVKKPRYFDGELPPPSEWLMEYEDAKDDNQWSDHTAIYYFKHFLKGDASAWFKLRVRPKIHGDWGWTDLRKLFEANYLGRAEQDRLRLVLSRMLMEGKDRAANFIPRVQQTMLLLDPLMNEYEQVNKIAEKLRPEYAIAVVEKDPKTVDELRDVCRVVEAARDLRKITFGKREPPKRDVQKACNQQMFKRSTFERRSRTPQKAKSTSVADNSRSCFRCGRNSHLVKDCRATTKLDGTILASKGENAKTFNVSTVSEDEKSDEEVKISTNVVIATAASEVSANNWLWVELICNGKKCSALMDSGAQKSIVSLELVNQHRWKLNSKKLSLSGPDNSPLNVVGSIIIDTEIKIGQTVKSKRHRWYVAEQLGARMLMGADLIVDFDLVLDLKRKRTQFYSRPGFITRKAESLPVRSQKILYVDCSADGLVATVPELNIPEVMVANSVAIVVDNVSPLIVMNMSNKEIVLAEGTKLAGYEKLDGDDNGVLAASITLPDSDETVKIGSDLSEDQIVDLKSLIQKYAKAFSLKGELGCAEEVKHKIPLIEGAKAVVEPIRRRPQLHIDEADRQVKSMLKAGVIRESNSPWSSAYVVVKKKTGDYRICVDFRKLNDLTKKDAFPLPNIETCLETLAGKQFYSSFDFAAGYWQMKMDDDSQELTAFRTESGHYEFLRMPFGLCNAPASFQRLMNVVFAGLKGMALQIYLDDVCIATATWKEHLVMLERFFELVIKSKLKLKPSKCQLAARSVKFLGHEISAEGIRQDRDKVKALEKLPRPQNVAELRRIIGLMSYYRKFVPRFAEMAAPLTALTKKNAKFEWGKDQEIAFVGLINALKTNAVLTFFNNVDPVALKTDASIKGIGGILLQKQNGVWKVVACYSRRLNECESHYGVTDMEGLAVVDSMKKFRPYLLGRRFDLIVDHCALCVLKSKLSTSPRIRRWSLMLQEFDFNVIYRKGNLHADVDCLSRAPVEDSNDFCLDEKIFSIHIPVNIDEWIEEYTDPESLVALDKAVKEEDNFKLISDVIYHCEELYVPQSKRQEMLSVAHDSKRGGHGGVMVTLAKLASFFWPTKAVDVDNYVKSCAECQAKKVERARPYGVLQHFEAYTPMEQVCIDTFGPISESLKGNRYVIVAVDCFTRFIEARAIQDVKAESCANFILEFCGRYGPPKRVRSDNGPQYLNDLVKDTLASFGVEHNWSVADHSQGNAPAERAIQTFQQKLMLNCSNQLDLDNWCSILPVTVLAMNTSISKSTGYTPFEMLFGREPEIFDNQISRISNPRDLHTKLIKHKLDEIYSRAIEVQDNARSTGARYFDASHRKREFKVGDLVMIRSPNRRKGKLEVKYLGPFKVIERKDHVYTIKEVSSGKVLKRHVESIKAYFPRSDTPQLSPQAGPSRVNQSAFRRGGKMHMTTASILMIMMMASFGIEIESVGQQEPPVLWQWVDKTVFGEMFTYDFLMVVENPCDSLASVSTKYNMTKMETHTMNGVFTVHNNLHEAMVTRCEQIYESLWEKSITNVFAKCSTRESLKDPYRHAEYPMRREKRNWATDIAIGGTIGSVLGPAGAVGGMAGAVVTDLVGTIWNYLTPYSDSNRLINTEKKVDEITVHLHKELNAFLNVTTQTFKVLNQTAQLVAQNRQALDQLITDLPEYIFGASYIMDFITHNSRLADRIAASCGNQVDVKAVAELIQLPVLDTIPKDDVRWISITPVKQNAVRFIFQAVAPSPDTHVVKASAFEIWNIAKNPAELLKYTGPSSLIFNSTANCAQSIELHENHLVFEHCDTKDFYSKTLQDWEVVRVSHNVLHEKQHTTIKDAGSVIWIYCFPGEIEIKGKVMSCPTNVFSLPADTSFKTSDWAYNSKRQTKVGTNKADINVVGHFVHSKINDEHDLLVQLENLRQANLGLQNIGPISKLDHTSQWTLAISIPLLFLISLMLCAVLYWKYYRNKSSAVKDSCYNTSAKKWDSVELDMRSVHT